jgi:hypothetical protein
VRKKLGKVSLFESGSPVAANETSGYPSPDKTIAADMAAGVHAGPTTPRSGGIVSFGSIITCAPVRAISQLHPLGTEYGHRLYFSLFVFITSTATRNADSLLLSNKRKILRKPKRNQDYVYISIEFLQSLKLHLPAPKEAQHEEDSLRESS